jgi:hypothetical protein
VKRLRMSISQRMEVRICELVMRMRHIMVTIIRAAAIRKARRPIFILTITFRNRMSNSNDFE